MKNSGFNKISLLFLVVATVYAFFSCGSLYAQGKKNSGTITIPSKNKKPKAQSTTRPRWAVTDLEFPSEVSNGYCENLSYKPSEDGRFFVGTGESLFLSMQEAYIAILSYCSETVSMDSTGSMYYLETSGPDVSTITDIVDYYVDEALEEVYILIFISNTNLKNIASGSYQSAWNIERKIEASSSSMHVHSEIIYTHEF